MKNFILIGAAGYIAPRHMQAIKSTGNNLIAAFDPYDGVGILDSFFPSADFFTEFEIFDRHIEKLLSKGIKIHYLSICSPNYLHDAHIRYGLRLGIEVICEKPLVLNPWNIKALMKIENDSSSKVNSILQLRLHPSIIELKQMVNSSPPDTKHKIDLNYITSRGNWYFSSWKADLKKSGGIASNIGIHFFDMLIWIFGDVISYELSFSDEKTMIGILVFKNSIVNWKLSVDKNELPSFISKELKTYRSIKINDEEMEFSNGFTDLHTLSYEQILEGKGFKISDSLKSIKLVSELRTLKIKND